MSRSRSAGLADLPLAEQRDRVLAARDGFRAVAGRRPGPAVPAARWTGRDACRHVVGDRPGVPVLRGPLAQARTGPGAPTDTDGVNAAVVAAHRDASRVELLAAPDRARDRIAAWVRRGGRPGRPAGARQRPVASPVGELPLLTVVAPGGCGRAVHAVDLQGQRPAPGYCRPGDAATLLDASAGRRAVPALLASGRSGCTGWPR